MRDDMKALVAERAALAIAIAREVAAERPVAEDDEDVVRFAAVDLEIWTEQERLRKVGEQMRATDALGRMVQGK